MIFVDEAKDITAFLRPGNRIPPRLRKAKWCHMWSDNNVEELHLFAELIGMKREWFQNKPGFPHYDLTETRRLVAISKGATAIPLREWLEKKGVGPWRKV